MNHMKYRVWSALGNTLEELKQWQEQGWYITSPGQTFFTLAKLESKNEQSGN